MNELQLKQRKRLLWVGMIGLMLGLIIVACVASSIQRRMFSNSPPTRQESKALPHKFNLASVRMLVNEYALFSDGDGIKLAAYPTATSLDSDKEFGKYGYLVYKLKDSAGSKEEIYLLSKRNLQGYKKYDLESILHKTIGGDRPKFLVDTEISSPFPQSSKAR